MTESPGVDAFEHPRHEEEHVRSERWPLGSDVAAIKTRVPEQDDGTLRINGQKIWMTNGGSANLVAVLVRTDEGNARPHQNLTTFLIEKESGFGETGPDVTIPGKIEKIGYKGVDTTGSIFDNHRVAATLDFRSSARNPDTASTR